MQLQRKPMERDEEIQGVGAEAGGKVEVEAGADGEQQQHHTAAFSVGLPSKIPSWFHKH